jgi:hypothetical protein
LQLRGRRTPIPEGCFDSYSMSHNSIQQRLHDDEHEQIPSGHQWPASRLSFLDMRRLTYVSNKVKRPINQIIKEAVIAYTTTMIAEIDAQADEDSSPGDS